MHSRALRVVTLSLCLALLTALIACGGGGGGSTPTTPTEPTNPSNPTPSVTSLAPSSAIAGSAAFTLTVNGTGFVSGSSVQWNGTTRSTTYVSASQLQASISAADVATAGTASITVSSPTPGGGTSTAIQFTTNNPAPTVASVSPSPITANSVGSNLVVTGTGFVTSSTITWNGTPRATNFVSSTRLETAITAADVATLAPVNISVHSAGPGGGDATAVQVPVENPAPAATSLSPSAVTNGSAGFPLTVNGTGFVPSSEVRWNGTTRPTTFVNSTRLTAAISAADVASVGNATVTVFSPTPGGGTTAGLTFAVTNAPLAQLSSISPASTYMGSNDLAIQIYGTNLSATSVARFDDTDLFTACVTDYYSGTKFLYALIPAAGLQTPSTHTITVKNGSTISNGVTFEVLPNPVPTINSISPASAGVGSGPVTITVSGTNFVPTSVVRFNGVDLATQSSSGYQITATIPATLLQKFGNNSVAVSNPAPGGGQSAALNFSTYLPLPSNDMVYDAQDGLLYVSVPSTAGSVLGNSIVSVDPHSGLLGTPIFVGSEPGKLAISDDGTTIWVALNGSSSVRKVDLTTKTATNVQVYFPGSQYGSLGTFGDLAVLPGNSNSVAVTNGSILTILDGSVKRANIGSATQIAFGNSATTLYATGGNYGYTIFTLDASGVASSQNRSLSNYTNDLVYASGRVYTTSGAVLGADTGALLGTLAASGPVAVDSSLGRVFVLNGGQYSYYYNRITAFDTDTMVPVGSVSIDGLSTDNNQNYTLLRWGQNGLAVRTATQLYLLTSNIVRDLSSSSTDLAVSISNPATGATGGNITFTSTVKNQGVKTATNVVLVQNLTAGASFVSATPSQGVCSGSGVVRCNFGTIASGSTATLQLIVTPNDAGDLKSTANVSAEQPDSDPTNDSATGTVTVTGTGYNPQPSLLNISPSAVLAGSDAFALTVSGSGFTASSVVKLGATELPTTYVNESQLTATVDKTSVAALGWSLVSVSNPTPGGGSTPSLPLNVYKIVSLDTNNLVFDPFTAKLWASVPSTATQVTGNSLVEIDTQTGALGSPINIGSEPGYMALSDDGQYLYTVLRGSKEVRRMGLPSRTPGARFGTTDYWNSAYAADRVSVMAGNHDAVAASGSSSGVQVYDVSGSTGVKRGAAGYYYGGLDLAWTDSSHLYASEGGDIHRFTVGASSLTQVDETSLTSFSGHLENYKGLLYSDGGGVVDPSPTTPHLYGKFPASGNTALDGGARQIYFFTGNSYSYPTLPKGIAAFNMDTYLQRAFLPLTLPDNSTGSSADLVRWGRDGLALRIWDNSYSPTPGKGKILIFRGPFVTPEMQYVHSAPLVSSVAPNSASAGSDNLWLTVTGTGFVPGAVALWNGQERTTKVESATSLKVAISSSDLVAAGSVSVTVQNPNSTASAALTFTIN